MDPYKLDEVIKEFETEVEKIKSVNEIYAMLDITHKEIIYNADLYKNNIDETLEIKNKLENALIDYEGYLKKFMEFNNSIKESLGKEIASIKLENIEFNTNILEKIEKLDSSYDKKFFEIKKENRELYQELEKLLSSKLERIKSDIEVNIRDGNINLEMGIGTQFDLKFIQFNELVVKKYDQVQKSNEEIEKKMNKILLFAGGIVALVAINIVIHFMFK